MAWGAKRGVDDLVEKLKNGTTGPSLAILSSRTFGDAEAEKLCTALEENKNLTELHCSGHTLTATGASCFSRALHKNTTLKRLSLGCSKFGDEAAKAFFTDWQNETLTYLDMELKGFGPSAMASLSDALAVKNALTEINLSRNSIGDDGVTNLFKGMSAASGLQKLDLSSNGITCDSCVYLGEALSQMSLKNDHLQLKLDDNNIGCVGVRALVEVEHRGNGSVQLLSLNKCGIRADGATSLIEGIRMNELFAKLEELYLAENCMEYFCSIANTPITKLDISGNPLRSTGIEVFSHNLMGTNNLQILNLSNIGLVDPAPLIQSLNTCKSLRELIMLGNCIGNEGCLNLTSNLQNTNLETLNLNGTGLKLEALEAVVQNLAAVKTLKTLELGGNKLGKEGRELVDRLKELRPELDIAIDKGDE